MSKFLSNAAFFIVLALTLCSSKPVRVACLDESAALEYQSELQRSLGPGYEVQTFMIGPGGLPDQAKEYLPDVVTINVLDVRRLGSLIEAARGIYTHPDIFICLPQDESAARIAERTALRYGSDSSKPSELPALLSKYGWSGPQGKRVVFIGDSITDGNWGEGRWEKDGPTPSERRSNYDFNHIFGHGYQAIIASHYLSEYPQLRYRFYNRGISGDTLEGLSARWDKDVISLRPDVLNVFVGINDSAGKTPENFDFARWESLYRNLIEKAKAENPDIKVVLCCPFIVEIAQVGGSPDFPARKEVVQRLAGIVRTIAADCSATLVPFDELIYGLVGENEAGNAKYWSWDGIHPTYAAHYKMAMKWIEVGIL